MFNSTVGKQTVTKRVKRRRGKRRVIRRTYNYTSARCQSDGGIEGREWDFHAQWIYDDNTSDEDTYAQKCSV